ncbi:MAG TPA: Maf family nucleotide pyrophosphatase [Bacteroidales bacterium]|nr:Maf family nucleotide pyrophosphatase [Bacteroidales bacterium]
MISDDFKKWHFILASGSPRRRKLLADMGFSFKVMEKQISESCPDGLKREEIAVFLAKRKAEEFLNEVKDDEIVITADTIVWCNNRVLGKPSDRDEAISILRELSGRVHEVITAVCLLSSRTSQTFFSETKVSFTILSEEEILSYVDNYYPYDKAGAYGIQEWIGMVGIDHIEGSFFNVMGLPVQKLYSNLKKFIHDHNNN